jgi:hypothetical protein
MVRGRAAPDYILALLQVPEPDLPAAADHCQPRAVEVEGSWEQVIDMPVQLGHTVFRVRVPHANDPIPSNGGEPPAMQAEGNAAYFPAMAGQLLGSRLAQ